MRLTYKIRQVIADHAALYGVWETACELVIGPVLYVAIATCGAALLVMAP